MTTSVKYANAAITDATTFRAWGTTVNSLFSAVGLVQTSDTGQIVWASATKATSGSQNQGYEIWRFNDSLQATAPIFFKVEYYTGTNASGNNEELRVTTGTGSNGAGTITGVTSSQTHTGNYGSSTAGSQTNQVLRACFSSGSFVAIADGDASIAANCPFAFVISRTIDSTGASTGEGMYFAWLDQTTWQCKQFNYTTATGYTAAQNLNAAPSWNYYLADDGNTSYVLPHYACIPHPVLVNGLVSVRNAFTYGGPSEGVLFPCILAGSTSHNYLVLGQNFNTGVTRSYAGTTLNNATAVTDWPYSAAWGNNLAVIWE